ncbi:MAG: hypothetical protein ACOYU7_05120 [Bacillota bacterium]
MLTKGPRLTRVVALVLVVILACFHIAGSALADNALGADQDRQGVLFLPVDNSEKAKAEQYQRDRAALRDLRARIAKEGGSPSDERYLAALADFAEKWKGGAGAQAGDYESGILDATGDVQPMFYYQSVWGVKA